MRLSKLFTSGFNDLLLISIISFTKSVNCLFNSIVVSLIGISFKGFAYNSSISPFFLPIKFSQYKTNFEFNTPNMYLIFSELYGIMYANSEVSHRTG